MSRRQSLRLDQRGVNTALTHALTVAITAILIVGLVNGVGTFFETEREETARDQLRTIGNRMANEVMQVSRLDTPGGGTTIVADHPASVAGYSYTAGVLTGSECADHSVSTDACLSLATDDRAVEVVVPLHNESGVTIDATSDGTFEVTTEKTSSASPRSAAGERITDVSIGSQVGVGAGVRRISAFSLTQTGNQPPTAEFTFSPSTPDDGTTITFNASGSEDPDGTIAEYRWDFDDDGTFEKTTSAATVDRSLSAGRTNVTLEVWDGNALSNTTRTIDIAGLSYLDDMDALSGDDRGLTFTIENNYGRSIDLRQLLIDPKDDTLGPLKEETSGHEIEIDGDSDDGYVEWYDKLSIDDGGEFVDLDESGSENGGYVRLDPNDQAVFDLTNFSSDVDGTEFTVGLRYEFTDGSLNSTVITDTVGGPDVSNYDVTAPGQDVDVTFDSTHQLADIEATVTGDASATLTEGDFSESGSGPYTYTADVSSGSDGTYTVELTTAETATGTDAGGLPVSDTEITGADVTWTSASDWDGSTTVEGSVVHANFGDHSADQVEMGYNTSGTGLVGYWPLDDPSGSNAPDESGTGNGGTINGDPASADGLGGSTSFVLDGNDDHIEVPSSSSLEVSDTDEVTVSMWVNKQSAQNSQTWVALFQHSDTSYNLQFNNGNDPEFTIYDGDWTAADNGNGISSNTWYHLVGTFDSEEIAFYRDGSKIEEVCQETAGASGNCKNGEVDSAGTNAGIGKNIDTGNRHVDAKIDELRVYDRALSDDEVERLYDTYVQSTYVTASKTASNTLSAGSLQLQYDVTSGPQETVEVKVITGGGDESDWITVPDGTGETSVTGITSDDDTFELRVRLSSSVRTESPVVEELGVTT